MVEGGWTITSMSPAIVCMNVKGINFDIVHDGTGDSFLIASYIYMESSVFLADGEMLHSKHYHQVLPSHLFLHNPNTQKRDDETSE